MKKLSLITLSLFAAISLQARENPFVPTTAYEEEKARIIEQNESLTTQEAQEAAYIKEMQKMMENVNSDGTLSERKPTAIPNILKPKVQEPKKDVVTKDEVKALLKKVEKKNERKTQQLVKKEIEKVKQEQATKEVVFVKPRTDVTSQTKTLNPLPFVKISYNDDEISLNTKYKMIKTFNLENENKIIIDFNAYTKFYTKRENLESTNFKNIAIGNHKEKRFFRVVVKTLNKPSAYKVSQENGLVTISY